MSWLKDVSVSPAGDKGALLRLNDVDEETHQNILGAISGKFGKITENRFDSIGPTVGNDLKSKSIKAIIISLLAVVVYLAIVFRKLSLVLSPWALGLSAVAALVHDVLVPIGLFTLLGHYLNIEITSVFNVSAYLTLSDFIFSARSRSSDIVCVSRHSIEIRSSFI